MNEDALDNSTLAASFKFCIWSLQGTLDENMATFPRDGFVDKPEFLTLGYRTRRPSGTLARIATDISRFLFWLSLMSDCTTRTAAPPLGFNLQNLLLLFWFLFHWDLTECLPRLRK